MNLRRWIFLAVFCGMLTGCNQSYSSGDRVLVSKCSYDTGITPPRRYDVVVFKYPEGPMEKHTPKNYIKRLLGLPGELLAIFFGRLYHRDPEPGAPPFYDDLKAGVQPNDLWREPNMHSGDEMAKQWFDEGKFTILRKPPSVMMALRRIVYDNDYQAKDLVGKLDRWSPSAGSTWKSDKATAFLSDGKAADSVDWLRYRHLLRPDGPFAGGMDIDKMLILDTLDYNTLQINEGFRNADIAQNSYAHAHWVGDLMLECNVEVTGTTGEFWFELSRGVDRFRAGFDLASGDCTLYRVDKDKNSVKLDQKPTRLKGPGNYLLRFANIDARLTVWVDRELPFGDGVEYDPPEVRKKGEKISDKELEARRGPRENDLEPASLGSKGAAVKVNHLRLWRDTYYRSRIKSNEPDTDYDHSLTREEWSKPSRWEPLHTQRFTTMYVQPGHYLCLGDNSQSSSDSRVWGLVPERLMLGRALLVYFPLERIGPIR